MNSSAIQTSVRYLSDGTICAWPIPFPYGTPSGVACKVMDLEGKEKLLTYGTDYTIKDNCVMTFVPAGSSIMLWMTGTMEEALAGASAKAMAHNDIALQSTPGNAGGAAVQPAPAASGNPEELLALSNEVRELKALQENALVQARLAEEDRQVRRIAATGDEAVTSLGSAISDAASDARQKLAEQADASARQIRSTAASVSSEAEEARQKALAAQAAADEAIRKLDEARAAFEQAVAQAGKAVEQAEENARQSIVMLAGNAQMAVAAAETDATARIRRDSELHNACINQHGTFTQTADWKAGSIIPLPDGMVYYPGRAMLGITCNGRVLVQDVEWQEVASVDDVTGPSANIRILIATQKGAVWSFWVIAANAGEKAIEAAAAAENARRRSEEWAWNAREYARDVENVRDDARRIVDEGAARIEETGRQADAWRKASAQSASSAADMADYARSAAWQASMQSMRPGIASLRSAEHIFGCASGVYIINPHVRTSPTIFMGVWPVQKFEDIQFDGIFFVGPKYPDNPNPPPAPLPRPGENTGNVPDASNPSAGGPVNWGPCGGHTSCNQSRS